MGGVPKVPHGFLLAGSRGFRFPVLGFRHQSPGHLLVAEPHREEEVALALAQQALADDALVLRDAHLLAHAELREEDEVPRVALCRAGPGTRAWPGRGSGA